MTNQPYEGPHGGHDPYQQQPWPGHGQDRPDDPYADRGHPGEQAQQWQGRTWEPQGGPPVSMEETAYLPRQQQEPGTGPGPQPGGPYGWQQPPGGHAAAAPDGQGYVGVRSQPQPELRAQDRAAAHGRAAAAPAPAPAPAAGSAGNTGSAPLTAAQRARAEGRSPVIDPGLQPAALTAALGLLLSGAAAVGTYALLVPLVLLQAVTAAGWFRLNGMWPARQGIALGFAGALAADAALLVSDRSPAAILGTLGVWVLLTLVLQLRSHADPEERMYGLMASVTAAALAIVAGGWLAADADAVSVGAAAVAAAVLVRALPLPTPVTMVAALLAAAGAGFGVAGPAGLDDTAGALLGAGAAVCALIGHRVAAYDYPSRFVHFTAGVALPLAAAAPAVYLLGRALGH
ncbi:MAG TPA: hypothetical protein VFP69_10530 [Streptomyces sp.]|nr:hypothetical protein [Streptomyces sp.]